MIQAASPLACATKPAKPAFADISRDAKLLRLGAQFESAWASRDCLPNTASDDEWSRFDAVANVIAERIVAMPATTPAGLALKARVVSFCHSSEPFDWHFLGDSTDARAAASIVRDLLAMQQS